MGCGGASGARHSAHDDQSERLGQALGVELSVRAALITGGTTPPHPPETVAGHVVDYSRIARIARRCPGRTREQLQAASE
jgi:hypothetical protein